MNTFPILCFLARPLIKVFFAAMGRLLVDHTSTPKPEVTLRRREWSPRDEDWDHPTLDNRLSRKYNIFGSS